MNTVESAVALLAAIEMLVNGVDNCGVDKFQVTAGEPAQPSGQCSVVSVWAPLYFNSADGLFGNDNPCVVVRGIQLAWRLDYCYTEQEEDHTAAQHLTTAICFYGLADAIWCGLLGQDLFGLKCADLQFDALTVSRDGGIVSASSGVRIQLDCLNTAGDPQDVVGVIAGQEEGGEFG
jgi:hypothetical protein